MTDHIQIGDISPVARYEADGAQTVFPYSFPIFAAANMAVYVGTEKQDTGYTVTGAGDSAGGTVVFAAAPADGALVTLARETVIERTSDFQQAGPFRAATVNTELDTIVAIEQELAETLGRALRVPVTAAQVSVELPAPEAGRVPKWNATGSGLINSTYDPDQAPGDAATALDTAETALDVANSALAAAIGAGFATITEYGPTPLLAGVQDYLMPEEVPEAVNLEVFVGGQRLYAGSDYTLTDLLGIGKTLHLVLGVSAGGVGSDWAAGLELYVRIIAKGLITDALASESIEERHIQTGAASNRWLGAGIVEAVNLAAGAVTLGKLDALSGPGAMIVGGEAGAPADLAAGAAGTVLTGQGAVAPVWKATRRELPVGAVAVGGAPNIDITGAWWASYDRLRVHLNGIRPLVSANGLAVRVVIGGAVKTGPTDYAYGLSATRYGDVDNRAANLAGTDRMLIEPTRWSNIDPLGRMYGWFDVFKEDGAFKIHGEVQYGATSDGGAAVYDVRFDGWLKALAGQTTEGLRLFLQSSGDFSTDGSVTVTAWEG